MGISTHAIAAAAMQLSHAGQAQPWAALKTARGWLASSQIVLRTSGDEHDLALAP